MKQIQIILATLLTGLIVLSSFNLSYFAKEWKSLFNGKDLSGWKIHGTEKWYVQDGELICESGPDKQYGYLATDDTFKDFELKVEFKQEADGNSGVFFRSSLDGTKISGWQAEVAPPGHDTGGIYEANGRGWLIKPDPKKDKFLKMGEWNQMKVRVVGDRVTTWLNDQQMVDLRDEKIGKANGSIALQIHSGGGIKVRWKNIYIQEIKDCALLLMPMVDACVSIPAPRTHRLCFGRHQSPLRHVPPRLGRKEG